MNSRCADCGRSIADRHFNAYLCLEHAAARRLSNWRGRMRLIKSDPELAAARRAYQATWARLKWANRPRRPEIGSCESEGCRNLFPVNRLGRPRQYCDECAKTYDDYRRTANNKTWYRKNAAHERDRARAWRLRNLERSRGEGRRRYWKTRRRAA